MLISCGSNNPHIRNMHDRKRLIISGSLVLTLAAVWMAYFTRQDGQKDALQTPTRESRHHDRTNASPAVTSLEPTGVAGTKRETPIALQPITDPIEVEKILEDIHSAAVTYDAAHLPEIDRYLLHPNLEIRKAAKDAMVILGDPAAGPLLRSASAQASSPREAVALLEAADYVELPSAKLKLKKKPKSTTPQKNQNSTSPGSAPVVPIQEQTPTHIQN